MSSDFRPFFGAFVSAFGVSATVQRPQAEAALSTRVIWLPTLNEDQPGGGTEFKRRDPRRLLAIQRTSALPTVEAGSVIVAPEESGGTVRRWTVDKLYEALEPDHVRVIVSLSRE